MTTKQKYFKGLLSGLALVLSLLASCSSKPEKAIIGKWSESNGAKTIEFSEEGTVSMKETWKTVRGHYKFIEKDEIEMELGTWGVPVVATVSISGDELTLSMPDKEALKYSRVK